MKQGLSVRCKKDGGRDREGDICRNQSRGEGGEKAHIELTVSSGGGGRKDNK